MNPYADVLLSWNVVEKRIRINPITAQRTGTLETYEIVMTGYFDVLENVKKHIIASQYKVMTTVNIERNILYWNIGKMIEEYSQWGSKFVENLSKDLRKEYPNSTGCRSR